jgi:hypothetical protein
VVPDEAEMIMSADAILAAAASLSGAIIGWGSSFATTWLQSRREDDLDRRRAEREALSERLKLQSEAIHRCTQLVAKWEAAGFVGKFVDGQLRVDGVALADAVLEAHQEGAALMTQVSAAFGGSGFGAEARTAIEMIAGLRPYPELARGAMQVAQHCLDEMNMARARTETQLKVPPAYVPESLLTIDDKESHPAVLVEKLLERTSSDADEVELRKGQFKEVRSLWYATTASKVPPDGKE